MYNKYPANKNSLQQKIKKIHKGDKICDKILNHNGTEKRVIFFNHRNIVDLRKE